MIWHGQQKQNSHHLFAKRVAVFDVQVQLIGTAYHPVLQGLSAVKWGWEWEEPLSPALTSSLTLSSGGHGDIPRIATFKPDILSVTESRTLQYFHQGFPEEDTTCQWGQVINSPRAQFFGISGLASSSKPGTKS